MTSRRCARSSSRAVGLRTLIRPNPLLADPWRASGAAAAERIPRVGHVLDLDRGYEHIWKNRFTGGARTNIRKAEKTGVIVEHGASPRHIETFYELFERSLLRWASRQHEPAWLTRARAHHRDPIRKFHVLAETLGDAFTIWLASVDGRPAAAAIVLIGANAHYTRGAMDADIAGPARANYLLHAEAIHHACEAGCRHYHFGESGTSSSLAQFKTRFGAEAYDYDEVRFERLPLTAADRRLRHAVKRAIRFGTLAELGRDSQARRPVSGIGVTCHGESRAPRRSARDRPPPRLQRLPREPAPRNAPIRPRRRSGGTSVSPLLIGRPYYPAGGMDRIPVRDDRQA